MHDKAQLKSQFIQTTRTKPNVIFPLTPTGMTHADHLGIETSASQQKWR